MKKLSTIFYCTLLSLTVQAQTDLTSIFVPNPGTSRSFKFASSSSINPGSEGNDQIWDFSSLSYSSAMTEQYLNASTTAGGANFPSANIYEIGFTAFYYTWNSTNKEYWGSYISSQSYNEFTNSAVFLTLPMSYGSEITDYFSGTSSSSVGPDAGQISTITGTVTTKYDGYGTLITNNGTFNNVKRIKTSLNYTKSYSATDYTDVTTELYYWYTPDGQVIYYMDISSGEVSTGGGWSGKDAVSYPLSPTAIVKIEENPGVATISPNPASNEITVYTENLKNGIYSLKIINENGSVVEELPVDIRNDNKITIKISSLRVGNYILNLASNDHSVSYKFVKK